MDSFVSACMRQAGLGCHARHTETPKPCALAHHMSPSNSSARPPCADLMAMQASRSRHGKMEKSLVSFATEYPTWEPDAAAKRMLQALGLQHPLQESPHFPYTAFAGRFQPSLASDAGAVTALPAPCGCCCCHCKVPSGMPPGSWRPGIDARAAAGHPGCLHGRAGR